MSATSQVWPSQSARDQPPQPGQVRDDRQLLRVSGEHLGRDEDRGRAGLVMLCGFVLVLFNHDETLSACKDTERQGHIHVCLYRNIW